jgi:SAM-dependent methyltransferase
MIPDSADDARDGLRGSMDSDDVPSGAGRQQDVPVDYTNSQHRLRRVTTKFALRARRRMYDAFVASLQPSADTTILDVGVTPDQVTEDSNFLEKWYPHAARITATSIEDASHLESKHPGLTFIQTSGEALPFADRQFDIAFSSAVIEHVGDRARQRRFVEEMLRVSKRFFITTPDRRFPIELHTFLPFVHWLPQPQHQRVLRAVGLHSWAKTENLNLLDEHDLRALFPAGVDPEIGGPRLLAMRSNLLAFGSSQKTDDASHADAGAGPAR